jgi:hypothetical protein
VVQEAVEVEVEVVLLKLALLVIRQALHHHKETLAVMVKQVANNMLLAVVAVLVRLAVLDQLRMAVQAVRELHLQFQVHQLLMRAVAVAASMIMVAVVLRVLVAQAVVVMVVVTQMAWRRLQQIVVVAVAVLVAIHYTQAARVVRVS